MKLRELLEGLEYDCIQGSLDQEITEVVNDSRMDKIKKGSLFICIEGANFD